MIKTAYLIVFGLILHDFPEGFAMATSYIHTSSMGVLIALAIALHNIPEEFAMVIPLLLTGKKELIFKTSILSALAEPLGAILGLFAVEFLPNLSPFFLSFAGGAMIFISFHELFPMASGYKRKGMFILGGFLSIIIYFGLKIIIN